MGRLLSLIVVAACGSSTAPRADDPQLDLRATVTERAIEGCPDAGLRKLAWIDAHMHCAGNPTTTGACDLTGWPDAAAKHGGGGGLVLATEHFAAEPDLGAVHKVFAQRNETAAALAADRPELGFAASLECWHEVAIEEPSWVARCKADVDRWVAAGAVGFKDHVGKQEVAEGELDVFRWIGAWNRAQRRCTVAPGSKTPNRDCMTQTGVRYPLLEDKWREVLTYIVATKRRAVFTHATSPISAPDRCFDPLSSTTRPCGHVTRAHLADFARWAHGHLDAEARRRIVIVHLGFLPPAVDALAKLLDAGLSVDTAAMLGVIGGAGCATRATLARFPRQIVFGSDNDLGTAGGCIDRNDGWFHLFGGRFGVKRSFSNLCGKLGSADVVGLELQTPHVDGCEHDLPTGMLARVMRDNLLEIVGCGSS